MRTFISSDYHFFHDNIRKYCDRPFNSVHEMNAHMVAEHNRMVGPKDLTYFLGDFAFGYDAVLKMLERMNGSFYLIKGNHDKGWWKKIPDLIRSLGRRKIAGYAEIKEIKCNGIHIVLCHYPLERWNRSHHGSLHFHGHCHGQHGNKGGLNFVPHRMDVGVDGSPYYNPYSLEFLVSTYYPSLCQNTTEPAGRRATK